MDLSIPDFLKTRETYRDIYEQYVDEASFMWVLRSHAVNQPHYYITDILELEDRIQAQLDGLMTAPEIAWDSCEKSLELGDAGEIFTAMIIAMRSHDVQKIQRAVETGLSVESYFPGLISAMGWLSADMVEPWIERFLNGKDMQHKYLGLGICSVRRFDPGEMLGNILQRSDCLEHTSLHARALRLVGELRRQDLMPALNATMLSDNADLKFWATWSAILLGQKEAVRNLQPFVFENNTYQERAIQLAFRVLPVELARSWISAMAGSKQLTRAVIKATGILGDPHAVNWLITKMTEVESARIAAESFSFITGIDLQKHQLSLDAPTEQEILPNDDPADKNVTLDEDENLPWPDVEKVAKLWRNHGQNFIVGNRYFLGRPLSLDLLKEKLKNGHQRQRHASALELALSDHATRLENTRAKIL